MENTLNRNSYRMEIIAVAIVATFAVVMACLCGMADAAGGTFVGSGADKLLRDFAKVVALAGVIAGVFNIIKGRLAIGVVVMVVAAIVFAFCQAPETFGKVGQSIIGIFF